MNMVIAWTGRKRQFKKTDVWSMYVKKNNNGKLRGCLELFSVERGGREKGWPVKMTSLKSSKIPKQKYSFLVL